MQKAGAYTGHQDSELNLQIDANLTQKSTGP